MALRIPWDKYESALLLDMYFKVASGEIKRQEAVVKLSADLRNLAINRGIVIDDIFRNTNGISLKMCEMQYIVTDGKSGLKKNNPSKAFKNIVDTYNNETEEYNKILEEARKMINSDSNFTNNYFTWLSQKVSGDKLSEFYMQYDDVENLLLKKRLITGKLFSTRNPDIIYSAVKVLENDSGFKRSYKSNDYLRMLNYYYSYLIYNNSLSVVEESGSAIPSAKKETVQAEKTQKNNTAENNSRLQLSRGRHFFDWLLLKYSEKTSLDIVGFMIMAEDFASNANLTYQNILDVSVSEAEKTIRGLSNNKEFCSLCKTTKRRSNFTIFSQYLNYLKVNNISIGTSRQTRSVKDNAAKSRKPSSRNGSYDFNEIENVDLEQGHGKYSCYFALWLIKNYSVSDDKANKYTDLVARASIYAINKKYTATRMLDSNNYYEVKDTISDLFKDGYFIAFDSEKSNVYKKILKKYLCFLGDFEENGNNIEALNLEREPEPTEILQASETASEPVAETMLDLTPNVTGETMPEITEILKPANVFANISEPKQTAVFDADVCRKIISDKFRKGFRIELKLPIPKLPQKPH